jgi:hypothetical protein
VEHVAVMSEPIKFVPISESQLDEILDAAFNPPQFTPGFSNDNFYEEWKNVQNKLKSALLDLGYRSWNDGGEDYTMADDWSFSRSHDVEIHRESMLADLRVLSVIQQVLAGLKQDYQVVVHHDLFLRDETPMCHLVVQQDGVFSQTDDPHMLKRLGLES